MLTRIAIKAQQQKAIRQTGNAMTQRVGSLARTCQANDVRLPFLAMKQVIFAMDSFSREEKLSENEIRG